MNITPVERLGRVAVGLGAIVAGVLLLVATGVAGIGFLFVAVMCTVMMAAMMGGMGHSDNKS